MHTFNRHCRLLAAIVKDPGVGPVINPARHSPEGLMLGANAWRGIVRDVEVPQHLVTFGFVASCALSIAALTRGGEGKWVKSIQIYPLVGEWERTIAFAGHVSGQNEVGMKVYEEKIGFNTRHDKVQRTSYALHCSKPITAFFAAGTTEEDPYTVKAAPRRPSSTSSATPSRYLQAKADGTPELFGIQAYIDEVLSVPMYDARAFVSQKRPASAAPFDYRTFASTCPRLSSDLPASSLAGIVHTVEFMDNKAKTPCTTDHTLIPDNRMMFNVHAVILFASRTSDNVY